ncbi:MAG: chemotaxis-specific protein-glutamate methyltransferase CheB [Candidatus Riflebacteria bacterium]|nr:chemotaxis-specific protein-glutamate methyltransferase CheB [Candidatus Riflebacteria bacterium]
MIRILVVEDSRMVRELVVQALQTDPEIAVVGTVSRGDEVLDRVLALRPDLITMDIQLPGLSGLDATRLIMQSCPTPVIILTSLTDDEESRIAFRSLAAGALMVLDKPVNFVGLSGDAFTRHLVQQVKLNHRVRMNAGALEGSPRAARGWHGSRRVKRFDVVGIGASAGGPMCLSRLLSGLPGDFGLPIVVVQHISRGFTQGFATWLGDQIGRPVVLARDRAKPEPGSVYLSPEDIHLEFDASGSFQHSGAPALRGHRPSVDVLFSSLAQMFRSRAIGVLLTGMGADGAQGLKKMRDAGATTFAQDEATSLVFGMPQEALKLRAVDQVLPLNAIGDALLELGGTGSGLPVQENSGPR